MLSESQIGADYWISQVRYKKEVPPGGSFFVLALLPNPVIQEEGS
jgi:hypothetical protein